MIVAPELDWTTLQQQCRQAAPEAFGGDGAPLNLIGGQWMNHGRPRPAISPVDERQLTTLPMIDLDAADAAILAASAEAAEWGRTPLEERRRKVDACLVALREHRTLIARLLIWEIGKPLKQAETDVDRCIDGVAWYLEHIERMVWGRRPIGVVSNIASWNYPYSVLMHAALVQLLAGNAVVAKTPTDGGVVALTVGFALARRAGLPVTLVSGAGGELGAALVRGHPVDCLAFVGGRSNGRAVASALLDGRKRHILEMEGVNAYGVWRFSQWELLGDQIKKGYDYGKQRCTAYARFVVERKLFPRFLETYLKALTSLKIGNPTAVAKAGDSPPALDFGPLINGATAETLRSDVAMAIGTGAIPIFDGRLDPARFLEGQTTGAYAAPVALLNVPRRHPLYHKEPFGPVDTIVLVDSEEELIAEMNVSNGSLVGSVACDDTALASDLGAQVRSFKIGINAMRSRGDRDEVFGGIGQSWRGCFVGGKYSVESVTIGPPGERLAGNFEEYTLMPERR